MTAKEVIDRLKTGNSRFVANKLDGKLQNNNRRENLITEQNPYAIILSCADSRVVPELAFDTGLGELFVIRIAGNIATKSSIASIEFAVAYLGSLVIVVMGHQNCGAVTAAVAGGDNGPNLNHLLSYISPAISASDKKATINEVVRKNAQLTVDVLKSNSSIIKEAINNEKLTILPAYYHLDSGQVEFL